MTVDGICFSDMNEIWYAKVEVDEWNPIQRQG